MGLTQSVFGNISLVFLSGGCMSCNLKRNGKKMYELEEPAAIQQIIAIFYHLGIWTRNDETTFVERGRKIFYYFYFVSFVASIALGAHLTDGRDERIFLTVISIIGAVLVYKLWFILWKKNEIFMFVQEIAAHSTYDEGEFIRVDNKTKIFMKFVQYFLFIVLIGLIFVTIMFPLASEKRLVFNIAFPSNRSNNKIVMWMALAFSIVGEMETAVCCAFTPIVWYLLYGFVLQYELLGSQIRNLGMNRTPEAASEPKLSVRQQTSYVEDLIAAIRNYDEINGKLEEFVSIFSKLFFLQIATGSLCICGSVYSLAFSSHENFIQDGVYCVMLAYSLFDIFLVMYLANEIALLSGRLLYCLFESDWLGQTKSCKKCILILGERLKRPQEIIVGKIYPLNLKTFNSIVNSAYSMFNILQSFRK